jgi:hypothetical protein
VKKYRKKPVEVEAIQFTGGNRGSVQAFCPDAVFGGITMERAIIPTLEGTMTAVEGDWIIRGIAGEFYPCKPDIFEQTYEPVE